MSHKKKQHQSEIQKTAGNNQWTNTHEKNLSAENKRDRRDGPGGENQ